MNFYPPPRIYRHLTGMLQFGILYFLCICTCTDFPEILSFFRIFAVETTKRLIDNRMRVNELRELSNR